MGPAFNATLLKAKEAGKSSRSVPLLNKLVSHGHDDDDEVNGNASQTGFLQRAMNVIGFCSIMSVDDFMRS